MDWQKTSKRDFEKAQEKIVQERWWKISQLSREGRAEVEAMENTHKQRLTQAILSQEKNFEKDTEKEFHRLLEKEGLELHYRPIWGQGNILSENHFRERAQHNVIVGNRETLERMEHQHDNAINALLNKEGLFMSKGNTQMNLPDHFNERGLKDQHDRGQDNSRGR